MVTNSTADFPITLDKCRKCENIIPIAQLDPEYDGPIATYTNDTCCNLECLSVNKKDLD